MASGMRFIFFAALLVSLVPICTGTQCLGGNAVHLSSTELTMEDLLAALEKSESFDETICQASMTFDFRSRRFTLTFISMMDLRHRRSSENAYMNIFTSMGLDKSKENPNQTSLQTRIDLGCYSGDDCDRALILIYFQWLISADHTELELATHPWILLASETKKNECSVGTAMTVEPCDGALCYWKYSSNAEQARGQCLTSPSDEGPTVILSTEVKMYEAYDEQIDGDDSEVRRDMLSVVLSIQFWCDLNNCNNRQVVKIIREAVYEHYDMWGAYKDQVKPEQGEISNGQNQTSTTTTVSTTTSIQSATSTTTASTTTSHAPAPQTSERSKITQTSIVFSTVSTISHISQPGSTTRSTANRSNTTSKPNRAHTSFASMRIVLVSVFLLWPN